MTEAIYSSETLVDFQRTTRPYTSEGSTLQNTTFIPITYKLKCTDVRLTLKKVRYRTKKKKVAAKENKKRTKGGGGGGGGK
jgi:hypothetical protein